MSIAIHYALGSLLARLTAVRITRQRVTRIRVLLVDLPRLFHDVIKNALKKRRSMVLVEQWPNADLQSEVRRLRANVVIAQLVDGVLPPPASGLVGMSPPVAVIGVDKGRAKTVVEMGDVSFKGLLEITRVAAVAVMNSELT